MRLVTLLIFAAMSAQLPARDTGSAVEPSRACSSHEQSVSRIGAVEGTYSSFAAPVAFF